MNRRQLPLAIIAGTALVLLVSATAAWADTFGSVPNQFTIDFVDIGNPGNADDTTGSPNPCGKVDYVYRMGTYEISRDMIIKSNTAGSLGITLADMTANGGNGVNRPATGVSWNEAARFVNWLNTSEGFTPAYKFAVQPGESGYSANANILLWQSGDAGYNAANPFRNDFARFFLPSVDEWYKAAYYSPSGSYFNYPTGSDTAPTAVSSGTAAGTAVYNQASSTGPADTTLAGGLSPFGTMGQGGNVGEWEETTVDLTNNNAGSSRDFRGGQWVVNSTGLLSSTRTGGSPTFENSTVGFRVASVPEPSIITLLVCGAAAVLMWWKRHKQIL
jgi:formylglycine-generating enzyme